MTSALLSIAYTAACAFVFLWASRAMSLSFRNQANSGDRTGLRTTHPELLDEHGFMTTDELLVIHFGDLGGNSVSVSS